MARHKDSNWVLPDGRMESWEQVSVAVLMDIRDELKLINQRIQCNDYELKLINDRIQCNDFKRMPHTLKKIASLCGRIPPRKKRGRPSTINS